ncbi:hypothetical protein CYMTET_13937 [Cymbomonas tetramitiformis]|uniref:Vesicle-fusing ATPase n=1 Tax=Cymbomonas tetramitiformis TaxID=36881 RepID=A0AAE0GHH8_9CHLO|nr:hypothetical protein CYMTET_13937 [Cymbomonas tetramitiformis]
MMARRFISNIGPSLLNIEAASAKIALNELLRSYSSTAAPKPDLSTLGSYSSEVSQPKWKRAAEEAEKAKDSEETAGTQAKSKHMQGSWKDANKILGSSSHRVAGEPPPKPQPRKNAARPATQSPGSALPEVTKTGDVRLREGLLEGVNWAELGVGGAAQELATIFRRVFASRAAPPEVVKRLGVRHVKGLLLHGPPGTGKTLIARQLAKALRSAPPKIVNGPEIFQRFVGQSEENVRDLFVGAENDQLKYGVKSPLHVIIFDEIDAVMKARSGGGSNTIVHDNVVNQLLVKLDGVQKLNNILVVGITNRPDLLDPALLRPGRLEVQVEIGLPDANAREEILQILCTTMQSEAVLSEDVRFAELAGLTKNFSGAELEGLVNSAASYALERYTKAAMSGGAGLNEEVLGKMMVSMEDFVKGVDEVQPALGTRMQRLDAMMPGGMVHRGEEFMRLQEACMQLVQCATSSADTPTHGRVTSALVTGSPGVGKTALVAWLGKQSSLPFVHVITPDGLQGKTDEEVARALKSAFDDAYNTPAAMLVIDDVERILGHSERHGVQNVRAGLTLMSLLKSTPPHGRQLVVLATSSLSSSELHHVIGPNAFHQIFHVPTLEIEEASEVMQTAGGLNAPAAQRVVSVMEAALGKSGVPIKHLLALGRMPIWQTTTGTEMSREISEVQVEQCLNRMRLAGFFGNR